MERTRRSISVLHRRLVDMVDHEDIQRGIALLKLQLALFFERLEKIRRRISGIAGIITGRLRSPSDS